jgi:signal recognition particle subunit SRP54
MFDFLSQKFSSFYSYLTGQHKLTEKNIDEALIKVQDTFLEADVPYAVVQDFITHIKQEVVGQKVFASLKPAELLMKIVHDKVLLFLGGASGVDFNFQIPSVIMVMGLQGAGKTTTIGKLVYYLKEQAQKKNKTRKIMVASVDFYRPAAVDQLAILAQQAGAFFYKSAETDPVKAAQDIYKKYQAESCDYLILDTAGRLHIDTVLLEELKRIDQALKPKYKLLVIDAMIGQESLEVARTFEEQVGFTGAILTKFDSDTRGGVAFAFKYALKKPILFVATGEKLPDLELFRAERMTNRIIGMGDMMTLAEKAQEKIKQVDQEKMYRSITQGKMTLVDFAQQIEMVNKLGSLSSIMKYMPAMGGLNISTDMLQKGEVEIKKFKAIISSMTMKERIHPKILDVSRKNRIAQGAGVTVADINTLLNRFEQGQQFVKMFKKMGQFK